MACGRRTGRLVSELDSLGVWVYYGRLLKLPRPIRRQCGRVAPSSLLSSFLLFHPNLQPPASHSQDVPQDLYCRGCRARFCTYSHRRHVHMQVRHDATHSQERSKKRRTSPQVVERAACVLGGGQKRNGEASPALAPCTKCVLLVGEADTSASGVERPPTCRVQTTKRRGGPEQLVVVVVVMGS